MNQREHEKMTTTEKLRADVLTYFASINATMDNSLSIRDFNSQLMANTFDPVARAALGTVLQELVADGIVVERTPTHYSLTDKGRIAAREAKEERTRTIAGER
jgi:hypothetical protein